MRPFHNVLFVAGPDESLVGLLARAVDLARSQNARLTLAGVVDRLPSWGALLTRGVGTEDLQQAVPEQRRADLVVMGRPGGPACRVSSSGTRRRPF